MADLDRLDRLTALVHGLAPRTEVYHLGPLAACGAASTVASDGLDMHLLTQGTVLASWPGGESTLRAPALLVVPGRVRHQLRPGDEPHSLFCARVRFDGPAAPLLLDSVDAPLCLSLADGHDDIRQIVQLIAIELAQPRCAQATLLAHAGDILLIAVLRHLVAVRALPVGVLAGLGEPGLARTLVALHEAPARAWTLERMAETAGMSRTVFAQRFRQVMGITPKRYLGDYRLMLARREVAAGRGLKRAASVAGYDSTAALSRALSRTREAQVLE